jgi:predicted HicB family RNase H-like nuclease
MVRMTVRVPAKLRDAAMAKADENGEYLSEVVRGALQSYVKTESTKKEAS